MSNVVFWKVDTCLLWGSVCGMMVYECYMERLGWIREFDLWWKLWALNKEQTFSMNIIFYETATHIVTLYMGSTVIPDGYLKLFQFISVHWVFTLNNIVTLMLRVFSYNKWLYINYYLFHSRHNRCLPMIIKES